MELLQTRCPACQSQEITEHMTYGDETERDRDFVPLLGVPAGLFRNEEHIPRRDQNLAEQDLARP